MQKSSSKVRGKGKTEKTERKIYDGEVIEPSAKTVGKSEPEIYDAEIVETPKAISGRPAIGYSPVTKQPSTKKRKPGYTQPTLPGMRNTRQFKGINGPSS
jgi:hypothetical protein